eukprot:SAG11_NODE_1586_length_4636_cov_9.336125_4_plen_157_part_00
MTGHVQVQLEGGSASVILEVFDSGYGAARRTIAHAIEQAAPLVDSGSAEWRRVEFSAPMRASDVPATVRLAVQSAAGAAGGLLGAARPHAELLPSQQLSNVAFGVRTLTTILAMQSSTGESQLPTDTPFSPAPHLQPFPIRPFRACAGCCPPAPSS